MLRPSPSKAPYTCARGQQHPKSSSWSTGNFLLELPSLGSRCLQPASLLHGHCETHSGCSNKHSATGHDRLCRYHIQTQGINRWPLLTTSRQCGFVRSTCAHRSTGVSRSCRRTLSYLTLTNSDLLQWNHSEELDRLAPGDPHSFHPDGVQENKQLAVCCSIFSTNLI